MEKLNTFINDSSIDIRTFNQVLAYKYYLAFYNEKFDIIPQITGKLFEQIEFWLQDSFNSGNLNICEEDIYKIADGTLLTIKGRSLAEAVIEKENLVPARIFVENGNNDTNLKRVANFKTNAINYEIKTAARNGEIRPKDISDRHHTFGTLYEHRIHLFAALCNQNSEISFKTKKHFDEENDPMFNGDFMAGIFTPRGIVTYHIKLKYWNLFHVKEIEYGPKYDGYTNEDIFERLDSLNTRSKKAKRPIKIIRLKRKKTSHID